MDMTGPLYPKKRKGRDDMGESKLDHAAEGILCGGDNHYHLKLS